MQTKLTVRSEEPTPYISLSRRLARKTVAHSEKEDAIIAQALAILDSRIRGNTVQLNSPNQVKNHLRLHFQKVEHEVFRVMFLDVKTRVIAWEDMFRGSLAEASVYPREVVKAALKHNAQAVILAHNHPSGGSTPSQSDIAITAALKSALKLVDVRCLDHLVVGEADVYSFAENGLM